MFGSRAVMSAYCSRESSSELNEEDDNPVGDPEGGAVRYLNNQVDISKRDEVHAKGGQENVRDQGPEEDQEGW